jgi:hypothetical protein
MDPAGSWGTLGTHVAAAKGARGAPVGGGDNSMNLKQARRRGEPVKSGELLPVTGHNL